jgi:hypothetical protein
MNTRKRHLLHRSRTSLLLSRLWKAFALSLIALPALAQTVSAPMLPPGKHLVVSYRAVINGTTPSGTTEVRSQATISGDDFSDLGPFTAVTPLTVGLLLQSPVHFLWNGFLSMQNIVALLNRGSTPISVSARMFDADGNALGETAVDIPANGEKDLPVNLLPGFRKDAFGVLRLNFPSELLDGNGLFYRFASDGKQLEFETGSNLQSGLFGTSYVTFNTIQPSRRTSQLENEVANWLSLSNMDSSQTKSFRADFYSQTGELFRTENISVPPLGRRDIEAGHQNPGPGNVGLIRIVPSDVNAPYSAILTRYGASANISALSKFYHFALLLPARYSSSLTQWAPISRGGNGENWVVLANAGALPGRFRVTFHSNSGTQLGSLDIDIAAFAQVHFFADSLLAPAETGAVEISSLNGAAFNAESTVYFYDRRTDEVTAAYATPARAPVSCEQVAAHNSFLGQADFLKIFNIGSQSAAPNLILFADSGTPLGSSGITFPPLTGTDMAIGQLPYSQGADHFGEVQVLCQPGSDVIGDLLRYQPSANGERIEAAESLPLR